MAAQPAAVSITDQVTIGGGQLAVIAGPCLVEDLALTTDIACRLRDVTAELGLPFVFKASFDKANRTSLANPRGPGLVRGLEILAAVRARVGVPILTDVHEPGQVAAAAAVCDVLQIPAFLCRQTDLLVAAGASGRAVNVKKGQFVAPQDMRHSLAKVTSTGNHRVFVTERGSSFGYHNLVVDMRGIPVMRELGCPVVFDATHSVQLPSAGGGASGGQRQFVAPLARAAVAAGADAVFMETHPDPDQAPCDGPNMIPLGEVRALLALLKELYALVHAARDAAPNGEA